MTVELATPRRSETSAAPQQTNTLAERARTPAPAHRTVGIMGCGTALPRHAVSSAEIAARLGVGEEWVVARTGIRNRRIARADERLSDLAAAAGEAALHRAGIDPTELDLVLVATVSADELTPNAAPLTAHSLGASRAGALDVGAACTGFLSALALGAAWIESGRGERVLVVGADMICWL